jgi:uncharacterized membrane protein YkvA (DUF1232 family)
MNSKKHNINRKFLEDHSENISDKDISKLSKKKRRLQKLLKLKSFSGQRKKLKLFIEIIKQYQKGNYREIPWRSITAISFTLLYIINPLDVVPDVLPIVGYVDDLSVFMALLSLAEKDLIEFEAWKTEQDIEN